MNSRNNRMKSYHVGVKGYIYLTTPTEKRHVKRQGNRFRRQQAVMRVKEGISDFHDWNAMLQAEEESYLGPHVDYAVVECYCMGCESVRHVEGWYDDMGEDFDRRSNGGSCYSDDEYYDDFSYDALSLLEIRELDRRQRDREIQRDREMWGESEAYDKSHDWYHPSNPEVMWEDYRHEQWREAMNADKANDRWLDKMWEDAWATERYQEEDEIVLELQNAKSVAELLAIHEGVAENPFSVLPHYGKRQ